MVIRKILLVCGILSSLLYVGGDIVAAMSWRSYSYTSQTISELLATGSPTRRFLTLIPYNPLVIALELAFGGRPVASASCGPGNSTGRLWRRLPDGILFPHASARGYRLTTDTMHILLTIVLVLLILLFIGFGRRLRESGSTSTRSARF
jgi:hypothetical protein